MQIKRKEVPRDIYLERQETSGLSIKAVTYDTTRSVQIELQNLEKKKNNKTKKNSLYVSRRT